MAISWIMLQILGVVLIIWLGYVYFDKRYKGSRQPHNHPSPGVNPLHGMEKTAEVFIDPKDGKKYRVYFNPRTGEREYVEEP